MSSEEPTVAQVGEQEENLQERQSVAVPIPQPQAVQQQEQQPSWWIRFRKGFKEKWFKWWLVELWYEYRELFKCFVVDFVISILIVAGFQGFHLVVKYFGIENDEGSAFLTIHKWGNLVAFVVFLGIFVRDIIHFYRNKE